VSCNQPTCMFRLFFSSLILPKHSRHVVSLHKVTRDADQALSYDVQDIIQSRCSHAPFCGVELESSQHDGSHYAIALVN
jgi:hypothetical protein